MFGVKRKHHRLIERWCRAIYEEHPDQVSAVFFNGPWILEVYAYPYEDSPVRMVTDMPILVEKLKDEVAWLTKREWFSGFEGLADGFEWRLYRGAH